MRINYTCHYCGYLWDKNIKDPEDIEEQCRSCGDMNITKKKAAEPIDYYATHLNLRLEKKEK